MIKKLFLCLLSCVCASSILAQNEVDGYRRETKSFNHLDLSVSLGTLGLGLDVATPIGKSFRLRTGFHYVHKFKPTMSFGVGLQDDKKGEIIDGQEVPSNFDKMSKLFSDLTGCEIDDKIDMVGEPTFYNFSFLVDFAPFKDKRWYFTTGIFAGPSQIAKAYNTTEDMPSLFSVTLYNKLYECAYNEEPVIYHGGDPIYLDPDLADKFIQYKRMIINIGDKADGSGPCYLAPNSQSMVKVKMKVNPVRPYLGFGFGDTFGKKGRESKYSFAFDAGVMFWGGTPQILTKECVEHTYYDENADLDKVYTELEDIDLAKDVVNMKGKAGSYVRFMKTFKVFPMLSFKITRRIF